MKEASTIKSKWVYSKAQPLDYLGVLCVPYLVLFFLLLVVAIDSFDGKFVCSFAY
jgi:hypothetical protein